MFLPLQKITLTLVTKEELNQLFESFSSMNILVIGDVMVDNYMWGKVERISPEAPVPVISIKDRERRLGGAANVALNLRALGATPIMASVIGNDENGKWFLSRLKQKEIGDQGIIVDPSRPTTVKTRIIGGSQHLLRVDEENSSDIPEMITAELFSKINNIITYDNIDAIIFEDYDKGVITPGLIKKVVELANEKVIPVTVDPKKRNFLNYKGVDLFKPNFREMLDGLKVDLNKNDFEGLFDAAGILHDNNDIKLVMVTLSELGVFISNGQVYYKLPAQMRDIADVSGAGDTVISVATLCYTQGLSPKNTAALANLAGGLVCEKVGVVPVEKGVFLRTAQEYYGNS